MKSDKKIKDFNDGEHLVVNLLIKKINKGITNAGSPYLTLTLQDSSGIIDAKLWDVKNEILKILEAGKIYEFTVEVLSYKNSLQLKIIKISPLVQSELNISDFIQSTNYSIDTLRNYINDLLSNIKNQNIKIITREMLRYYEKDFYTYPAAVSIHHSFMGGLATHTYGMLKLAEEIVKIYPILNKDLLVAGILLHDLGKIEELSGNLTNEYTLKGKLIGHISIGESRLFEIGKQLGLEDSEELLLLRHIVLSHHGELEFGSPVRPLIIEAEIINFIDNIDARINTIEKSFENIEYKDFGQKLFSLENRAFYKHNLNDK